MNTNGKNSLDIPILVEPINDPPLINLPPFVIMDQGSEEVSIFSRVRNKSAVFVGDPDLLHYPGMGTTVIGDIPSTFLGLLVVCKNKWIMKVESPAKFCC